MYSVVNKPLRSVRCNATTRREKHSNMRKTYSEKRKTQDKKLRASFGAIAQDEKERVSSIWEAHKEFFAREKKNEKENTIEPIVVDNEDLDSANGFFESE
jgi:hypothetical protein